MTIINGQNTIEDKVNSLYDANYTQGRVHPTLAAGAPVVCGAADWGLGAVSPQVPANASPTAYHVSGVTIETCDVTDAVFELALYYGDSDTLMATSRASISGGFWGNMFDLVPSVKLEANERMRMKLASSDGLANQATLTISIKYRLLE